MGNWDGSKPNNDGERELIDRAVKALEAELATKTCNKQIVSKLENAELARDSEETCNNKQVISKLVASEDAISIQVVIEWLKAKDIIKLSSQEETARKELEALSSVTPKQEPCDDAISRADAEALFRTARSKLNPSDYKTADEFNTRDLMLLNAEQMIHLLPSVTTKQMTGHWIYDRTRDWDGECKYECSCCGMGSDVDYAYCMRCGARMVEPQESEEQE